MIRPQPARWFELLVARDDATLALEALAGTGAIELEARPSAVLPAALADIRVPMQQFAELALRYHDYWPSDRWKASAFPEPPATTLARCLATIRSWAQDAEALIGQLQRGDAERGDLVRWKRVIDALAGSRIDLACMAGAGPVLQGRLFVFVQGGEPAFGPALLVRRFEAGGLAHALALGTPEDVGRLAQQTTAQKGGVWALPAWLQPDNARTDAHIAARLAGLEREDASAHAQLAALADRHDLRGVLGDAARLEWMLENVRALESGELFCWITGWTSDRAGQSLATALDRSRARSILHGPPPPAATAAPLLLANPWWARPYEIFIRALGMPSRDEADVSVLLAFVVPLMFGYMFADVGQGLVIAIAGLALRRHFPLARLFVAGGLAAAVFGTLFGSVFSLPGFHPLWFEPLDDPLAILLLPLVGGAVLLATGLLLSALEALWRGEFEAWLASDAGFIAVYVGLLVGFVQPAGFAVAALGTCAFCLGHAWRRRRLGAIAGALAELVERTLQIMINTLSFARVGAFALAHAGLSSAIVTLMHASGNMIVQAAVLIVGNVIVIVLEGLVVSIQTTRLVLFEFFTRFLAAGGRLFRPLPVPPSTLQERGMKTSYKFTTALVALALVMGVGATALLVTGAPALAATAPGAAAAGGGGGEAAGFGLIAAAVSTAFAALGAGLAVARVGTAAVGALAEKPELFGRLLIFVGLAEGIAIYGLIVSILILNRLA
ncbi:MAG TPA: ATPase [Casimicrobiaceae bacterium]|nr:ATPase [Casimicrobiaceae bacterium]